MITICVVTFNTPAALLQACLSSIRSSAALAEEHCEIIIVDNASSIPPDLEGAEGVRFHTSTSNHGFATAVNRAVRLAGGDKVLCLNPDATLVPTALRSLSRTLEAQTGPALLAGFLLKDGRPQVDAYLLWRYSSGRLLRRSRYRRVLEERRRAGVPFEVRKVSGGALFGRTADLLALGPFDERFFLYGEDADLSIRARRSGFRLLAVPEAAVAHRAGSSADLHGALVERARTDAAIRLVRYRSGYLRSLLARLELLLVTIVGLAASGRSSSRDATTRLARLPELTRWNVRSHVRKFSP